MLMPAFTIKTPAKINLFLSIQGLRPDGYHELGMVMQTMTLFDELTFEPDLSYDNIVLRIADSESGHALAAEAREQNLVVKAYRRFWDYAQLPPIGLKVTLNKQIPVQAGLGGGSSDAAAVLLVLNHLIHNRLSLHELQQLAAGLGSDVPFFLTGGLALATGRGEMVQPLPVEPGYLTASQKAWVIVKPRGWGIPTPTAYQLVRQSGRYSSLTPEHMMLALRRLTERKITVEEFETYLHNDFEPVLFQEYPALQEMAARMRQLGIRRPLLSGSGPSMTGLLTWTPAHQKALLQAFPENEYQIFWTHPHLNGPLQAAMPSEQLAYR